MNSRERGGITSKLIVLLCLLALLLLVYLLRHPLLRAAGEFYVINESPVKADAIILLSDDNTRAERAARCAELYRAGWAPRIVASGRRLRPYAALTDLMQRDLVERGVPAQAVVKFEHNAESTLGEALYLKDFIAERHWRRVLIVTSNYHTRRARYIYRRVFPPGLLVRFVAANDTDYVPDGWWESRVGLKIWVRETMAFVAAIWELRHDKPVPEVVASDPPPGPLGPRRRQGDGVSSQAPGAAISSPLPIYTAPRRVI